MMVSGGSGDHPQFDSLATLEIAWIEFLRLLTDDTDPRLDLCREDGDQFEARV